MPQYIDGFGQSYHILLVEDDKQYARYVEIVLEDAFPYCSMTHAEDLASGMAALRDNDNFSAVLLDLTLPDSEDLDTLKTLIAKFPNQNVIVLTGVSGEEMGIKAVKVGAQDFLVKGQFSPSELIKTLQYSIERKHILNRLNEAQRLAKIGYWTYNTADDHFSASKEVYRIFGLSRELSESNTGTLEQEDYPLYAMLGQVRAWYEAEEEPHAAKIQKDLQIPLPDGDVHYALLRVHVTPTSDGPIYNGLIQDVTEEKRAEALQKAHDLAQEGMRVREQILANVSHEMRTPMNAIVGMTHLLEDMSSSEEHARAVKIIRQSSDVLLELINDILEVSALQRNIATFRAERFNLHQVFRQLHDTFHHKAQKKGLLLSVNVSPLVPDYAVGDQLRLNQVLYNLVANAIKFTDKGKVSVSVSLALETDLDFRLEVSVADTGIGIPVNQQQMIFETFTRIIDNNRMVEGTGLGLSIAQKIVSQQGNRIHLMSAPGEGATFSFEWQLKKASASDELPDNSRLSITRPGLLPKSILVVEDHRINQVVMQKTLEKEWPHAKVVIANHGQEAIDLLSKETYDVVLMDLYMPVLNGVETTLYIRKNMPHLAATPILAMTAQYIKPADWEGYLAYGLNDYVLKPFKPQDLFLKIVYHLSLSNRHETA